MATFLTYFTSCALLLTWSWRTSTAVPVRAPGAGRDQQCAALFKDLLFSTRGNFIEDLCHGMIPFSDVTLRSAETVYACAPNPTENSNCWMQRNSSFSESECMRNIMKDLAFYDAAMQSYLKSDLSRPEIEIPPLRHTLTIIQELRRGCSLTANGDISSMEDSTNLWPNDSFKNRQKMCKMMKGLHVRSITINRALGYISSGDHRK
ncbi:interleukin-12 subunit alpha [Oryzias melastigma]|uniref:interleukin-12 subunit alpha n=1 Tax=Oryzias melastigma TaxID=30732 RepID=UPI00168D570C|nr:interleukin-12 subunit alpha [Oryzias melastigma]